MVIKKKKKKNSKPYVNVTLQSEQSHAASHTWPITFSNKKKHTWPIKFKKLTSLSTTLSDLSVLCLTTSLNFGVIITHTYSSSCWIWVGIL